jgi:hypothetical protein
MPSNTPNFDLPYPLGSEPVADGDDAIRLLALAVDSLVKGASTVITTDASGNATVTHGLGRAPLTVVAVTGVNSGTGWLVSTTAVTATTFTVNVRNSTTGALYTGGFTIRWIAI